ncbi:MAG: IS4 family transposase, partial [Bacteroidales bacterium]
MTREQRQKQYRRERKETEAVQERIEEYTQKKTRKAIDMVRRAIREGIRFDYLLSDSWFTCSDRVRFIKSGHVRCHFPGMIRMAKTKYRYQGKMRSAKEMVKLLQTRKEIRYSRRLKCYYGRAEVELSGIKVKLFFCRRTRNGDWTGLLTTNTKL